MCDDKNPPSLYENGNSFPDFHYKPALAVCYFILHCIVCLSVCRVWWIVDTQSTHAKEWMTELWINANNSCTSVPPTISGYGRQHNWQETRRIQTRHRTLYCPALWLGDYTTDRTDRHRNGKWSWYSTVLYTFGITYQLTIYLKRDSQQQ